MDLFRKQPKFNTVNIGLGSSKPMYLKPTKKELNEIRSAGRLSLTPHGVVPKKAKPKRRRTFIEAGELAAEFRSYQGKSAGEFVGDFSSGYDSRSALNRNLGL